MTTRKDYRAIAEIIKEAGEDYNGGTPADVLLISIEEQLADYFESDNPKFKRDKFIKACNGD